MQRAMSFLIDTNVIIAAEPFAGKLEQLQPQVSRFLSQTTKHGHTVWVHPASRDDLLQTIDPSHRKQNLAAFTKYAALQETEVPEEIWECYPANPNDNDRRDARILSALHAGAVDFLVTNDRKLRAHAIRLGHEPRVLRPSEAAHRLSLWHPEAPLPPPQVEVVAAYNLDASQSIFDGLREDYDDFDGWLGRVKKDAVNRRCWVVRQHDGTYDGIALLKISDDHPVNKHQQAIKLSTFKVADHASGRRLGELLLKAVLRWAENEPGRPNDIFVEVKDKKDRLTEFLPEFGFTPVGRKTADEGIYLKPLDPSKNGSADGLQFHIKYGPPALKAGQPIYVIPITPEWYDGLFPDAEILGASGSMLLPGIHTDSRAHGNAMRKAYLCRAPQASIPPGALLLFYRSQGVHKGDGAVSAVGVAERSSKGTDPTETATLSFKRTVYSPEEIEGLHAGGRAVLTILFRHDRFVIPTWPLAELISNKVVKAAPQSVVRVKNAEGIAWVEHQLNASH